MKVSHTSLDGVLLVEPATFGDDRGFFLETWSRKNYLQAGFPNVEFVQDNHSRSSKGVLRGMHYQLGHPQGKLVQVTRGAVFDVVVDIRAGSPTFGKWFGSVLNDEEHKQIYIPPGFAHGFSVLSEIADFCYKCTDYYHPEDEYGILSSDPEIGISWPKGESILSDKDRNYSPLNAIPERRLPRYQR